MRAVGTAVAAFAVICFQIPTTGVGLAQDAPAMIRTGPVNNPAGDPVGLNVQHSPTLVDLGGGKLVAAFYDAGSFNGTNNHFIGYAYSSDNGVTWTDAGRLPDSVKGDSLNPVLAFNKSTGAVFLLANNGSNFDTLPVFRSTNAGRTFAAPANAAPGYLGTGNGQFQPWMAIDNFAGSGFGNIYVCWNRYEGTGPSEIRFSRSTDNGANFGPNRGLRVAAGGPGCFVTVSPNHQVSIFYLRGTGQFGQGGDNKLFMRRSLDRGVTFKPEVQVADLRTTTANGFLQLHGRVYATSYPQAAVNPVAARPYIYVVYNDDTTPANQSDDNGNLYLVRSTDGGVTWSAPSRINDDVPGDQFFPNIAFVNAGERLMVSYYSRSHDPQNFMFHRRGRLATLSAAGAPVFNPSFQISPDTFPLGATSSPFALNYLGEYTGIAGGAGAVSTVWTDGRRATKTGGSGLDIYFARIVAPPPSGKLTLGVTATPASVSLGRRTTVKITATATGGPVNDAVVHVNPTFGLAFLNATPSSGACTLIGQRIDCFLGTIPSGASRSISILTAGVQAPATRTLTVFGTTSSRPATSAPTEELAETFAVPVGQPSKPIKTLTLSSGNIAVPIPKAITNTVSGVTPNYATVKFTVADVEGFAVRVTPLVRLNYPHDQDLGITMTAPDFGAVTTFNPLAHLNGNGPNFGSGANNCSGTPTRFSDNFLPSIIDVASPFAQRVGSFAPMHLGLEVKGDWVVRFSNYSPSATGVIGCVQIVIAYEPL